MSYNEIKYFSDIGSSSEPAAEIISNAVDLVMAAMHRDYGNKGMTNSFAMSGSEYEKKNDLVKKAILSFAGSNSGVREIVEKKHLVNAFDNPTFVSIYNAIVSESLLGIITKTNPAQIMNFANISEVDLGDSLTYEIEPKGLPIAQRNSYMSNVVLTDSFSVTPITVTPNVYSLGSSIDYIRILANNFDFGKEMARVAMGLLYAQFKLVVGIIFDTANLTGTPLYEATFDATKYMLMISYLQALNSAGVEAYGTINAFQAQGTIATTNYGFASQDEMVKKGWLGEAYGINNIAIEQATDLSAPFITANLSTLLLVPNNKILLLSNVGDKPVKLVRENFIRVMSKEPKAGSLYKQDYTYTMAFDAGLATQAHFALQGVA